MIAVLAGGVGAARLLEGLVRAVDPADVHVIVNTGDDTVLHGLQICPDLDTILYTLAGVSNPETGWGLRGETWAAMEWLERYGGPTWFRLGDRDLATHLYRTGRLSAGAGLTEVTAELAAAWGLRLHLLPMSEDPVRTRVTLESGAEVEFQEYFVRLRHAVAVRSVRYEGAERAAPAPGVLETLRTAELIVLAPSNPVLSLGPILSIPAIGEAVRRRRHAVVGVSPIVQGAALKGPADRLLVELGGEASPVGVATVLRPFVGSLVLDEADASHAPALVELGVNPVTAATVMTDPDVATELARVVLTAGREHAAQR